VIAGAITGLAVAFLQFFLIQPLIIEAVALHLNLAQRALGSVCRP
jgi:predicted cobalt transporter CbtA